MISASGQGLVHVTVRIPDAQGRLCPNADNPVRFSLPGEGTLAGVGNGNPTSLERFDAGMRKVLHGLCLAVVGSTREPGRIAFSAEAEGLGGGAVTIEVK